MIEDGEFDVEAWRNAPTDEVPLREALIALLYAWDSRKPWHPDHPVSHRVWLLRMQKASNDAYACLRRLGTDDERLRITASGPSGVDHG